MALGTISLDGEAGLAVMAGATGFTLSHVSHGYPFAATIGENLGVAVRTFVCGRMEVMAEVTNDSTTAVFEGQVSRFIANVALVAVPS